MELTKGQILALQAIEEVGKSHPNGGGIVTISGFAGTGKTTLLRTIAEESDMPTVLTPTGKAAVRAMEVAPVNAQTIHRWLYEVAEDPKTGRLVTALRSEVVLPANKTIFVDEASMVTFQMYKDLYETCRSHGLNIVYIGDGFQLPPVEMKEEYRSFSVLSESTPAHYRVQMTEVVRQALDSPIIRASMEVRDMRSSLGELGCLPVINPLALAQEAAKTFENDGVAICHRNATRHQLNEAIRKHLGITQEKIQKGEPLMVLQNNYELDVYNGEILTVLDEPKLLGDRPVIVTDRYANESLNMWFYRTRVDTPIGKRPVLFADREVFGTAGKIAPKFIRNAGRDIHRSMKLEDMKAEGGISYSDLQTVKGDEVLNCNLGYCLTAHKAQGSEFPETIVAIEDSVRLHSPEGRRWVYTAISRAKKSIKICWM